jgi:ABC-2 type transport system permease protein
MTSLTIYKRELTSYFAQPTAYAIIVIFLALSMGLTFSFGNFMRVGDASLEWTFFFWHPWIFMLLAPAVGMKLWSDEQRTGTIELLGTFPLSTWSAITMLVSACTRDQVVCLIVSVAVCVTMVLCGYDDFTRELGKAASPAVVEAVTSIGVWEHFRSLNRGLFRLQDLVWFGSFIFVCLLGTSAILSAKRA